MKYSSAPEKLGMKSLAMLFPLWGVMAPAALALFVVLLLRLPAHISLTYSLGIICALLAVIGFCAFFAVLFDDDQIRVSKEGLAFPLKFWPALRYKSQYKWVELSSLRLNWHRQNRFAADENLTLGFSNGGMARLKLALLEQKQLEQFFIAFEACAFNCERDAELTDFECAIQANEEGGQSSLTELWDRTLAQQFSPATFTPLEPNTLLQDGRYQILRQLAFGGFSAVYLARPAGGGFVVLKESCLPQNGQLKEDIQSKATELFEREASLLARLSHPNIGKIMDHFAQGGRQYIALEHIRGIDLGRYVRESGAQNVTTVLNFARQIGEALDYLHSQSPPIVHRDITPDNLLLRPDGQIMLIDFGAAKEIIGSFTGTIIGKQAYMAPEQFKGKPEPASDIYSLGATLYYLATAKSPEPLTSSTLEPEVSESWQATQDWSKLQSLIARCTDLDPFKRPDTQTLLAVLNSQSEEHKAKTEDEAADNNEQEVVAP